jgi:serine/threonine protein kinase/dienelactone hydrolase
MKGCLSQRDMAAFVEASASAEELAGWRRHLRVCDRCAEAAARLRAGLVPASEPPEAAPAPFNPPEPAPPVVGLEPNLQIGDFRLERRLGSGGMGVVYQAVQVSLNRRVALKVLPMSLARTASAMERFHREARAAAKLRHPNIVTIHADGADGNVCYFAMEMIDGRNLDQVIAELREAKSPHPSPAESSTEESAEGETQAEDRARMPCLLQACSSDSEYFNTVARLVGEVADALHYAHGQGIIHRDVKPSNFMLTRNGRLILLDFGIARICQEHAVTLTSSFVGTPRYTSPEQITGGPDKVDHRADIYSLGVTLYELLTLEPLFDGDTQQQVIGQILSREPRRPRHVNRAIPADLETICCKAIEKDPARRYQSAGELAEDLRRYLGRQVIKARRAGATDRLVKLVRRRTAIVTLAAGIVVAVAFAATITWRHYTMLWAQQNALAEIDGLIESGNYLRALILAEKAERFIPDDPLLVSRWPRLSRECTIITNPLGAKVYIGGYPEKGRRWKYLGRSPIEKARVPFGTYRWRVEQAGFTPVEVVRSNEPPSPSVDPATLTAGHIGFTLHKKVEFPPDMVWIPPSELTQHHLFHGRRNIPSAPAFLIDKWEVTNRRYKDFVDDGGYERPEFWQEAFVKDGRTLTWEQARELFRDQTGGYGPAVWKNGTYPPGQADYPVGGVSWYEAAAYANYRGKELPTIFHWLLAARASDVPGRIAHYCNFDKTSAPVGHYTGMGRFGLYDAAGNVREWCYNTVEGDESVRSILGGACDDSEYMFTSGETRSPWDRDLTNGLRCAIYLGGRQAVPEQAFQPAPCKHRDFAHFTPVPDEVLDSYMNTWYKYDRTELNARVDQVDLDRNFCRRERITFDAAYPNERVIAYLHLPSGFKPPYQAVVWFPGGEAREDPWDEKAHRLEITAILQSGRAVIVPFYKGTYERRLESPFFPPDTILSRNLYVQESQDLRRAIDYLETREDIDAGKLAYVGLGWGAQMGPVMIAVEERFKTGILLLGGICACERHPTSDPANFAPRVKIPVLMINAREDSAFPYETAQKPLFDLLGTPEPDKKHLLFPGGHSIPWEYRKQYYSEIVKWLDQRLGPAEKTDKDD